MFSNFLAIKIGTTVGFLEILTSIVELNTQSIKEIANAINKLPNREEFEQVKSVVSKTQEKAEQSMETISKAFKTIEEQDKRGKNI